MRFLAVVAEYGIWVAVGGLVLMSFLVDCLGSWRADGSPFAWLRSDGEEDHESAE